MFASLQTPQRSRIWGHWKTLWWRDKHLGIEIIIFENYDDTIEGVKDDNLDDLKAYLAQKFSLSGQAARR